MIKLKDGRVLDLVPLSRKISIKGLLDYINELIDEDAFLVKDEPFSYTAEKDWYESTLDKIKKDEHIHYFALFNGKVVAGVNATKGRGRERNNVCLGIAVLKEFRGIGFGEQLLQFILETVKKRWKPKNLFLEVFKDNKRALGLYKKMGFVEIAKYPEWIKYKGRYLDKLVLLYKEKMN